MSTINPDRVITSSSVYPMTAMFLSAIRAQGATLSPDGAIVDADGAARFCFVDSSGNWDLAATPGVYIDRHTFADLKSSYKRQLALVTLTNGTKIGVSVMVDPGSPIDPG